MEKLQTQMGELFAKKIGDNLGLNKEEEDNSFAGALSGAAREVLPDLLRTAGETLLPKLAGMIPDRSGSAGAPAAPALPASPAPAALPAPAGPVVEPSSGLEAVPSEVAGAPAGAPVVPPADREIRVKQARLVAIQSVVAFARPLGVLALARPDPAAAWMQEVAPNGRTLSDVYDAMTEQGRKALAGEDGWKKFTEILERVSPTDAVGLTEVATIEGGPEWIAQFLEAGPWNDSEDDAAGEPE